MTDVGVKSAMNAVILEQMSVGFGVAKVVDGNNLELAPVVIFIQCSENIATDAAKTVDCDTDCHRLTPWVVVFCSFNLSNVVNITTKKE